jgi:hypothetical protein
MGKRAYKYELTLHLQQYANGETEPGKQLRINFDNHDEIFGVIDRIREKDPFSDKEQATEFALGLNNLVR